MVGDLEPEAPVKSYGGLQADSGIQIEPGAALALGEGEQLGHQRLSHALAPVFRPDEKTFQLAQALGFPAKGHAAQQGFSLIGSPNPQQVFPSVVGSIVALVRAKLLHHKAVVLGEKVQHLRGGQAGGADLHWIFGFSHGLLPPPRRRRWPQ